MEFRIMSGGIEKPISGTRCSELTGGCQMIYII